ncbi:MAG: DUF3887 domain-containing protein [Pygmaiobacter sp.]
MKKTSLLFFITLLCAALFFGCGDKPLPEGFDEATVRTAAQEVVTQLSAKDYDAIITRMDQSTAATIGKDKIEKAWTPYAEARGAFQSFKKEKFYGENGYGVASVVALYEQGKVTFTLSFNQEMQLVGLILK